MPRPLLFALLALLLAACAPQSSAPAPAPAPATLKVLTHDSFNVSESVLEVFEQANGVKVEFIKGGDAGAMLNQAILSKSAPLADVMFGVDNTFLGRALDADLFEPYPSVALSSIPADLRLDDSNRLLPVDYGYVLINYDIAALEAADLAPPADLRALTKPEWRDKLIVQNPATSSSGLAFLVATVAQFGESGPYTWRDFWRELRANDVLVTEGWEDAYYTQFSGSSGKGPRPLVVSYATSPAAEVYFSEGKLKAPPTGNVLATGFRQVEFVGIVKGTQRRALAEKFVDFMLAKPFQDDIPLQMFVYPASSAATLPEVFKSFALTPPAVPPISAEAIAVGREGWIAEWTTIVLR
ncbi:MAG: thiamine ABC transporter substrate-binding protein [Chloroflexales bacterium]|nr:thiamine ABC transporter substrate-binding protein [Chloroflexales bacterium]